MPSAKRVLLRLTVSYTSLMPNKAKMIGEKKKRITFDVLDALIQDLLEHLGVRQLLLDLCNDAVGQLLLLPLLDRLLVSDPRIEDCLSLAGNRRLLLQLKSL